MAADQAAHDGLRVWLSRFRDDRMWAATERQEKVAQARLDGAEVVEVMPVSEHARRLAERQDQHDHALNEVAACLRAEWAALARSEGVVSVARRIAERGVLAGEVGNLRAALRSLDAGEPDERVEGSIAVFDDLRPDETAGGGCICHRNVARGREGGAWHPGCPVHPNEGPSVPVGERPERVEGDSLRRAVYAETHGDPPDRECLRGSDDKWAGYVLGVEEAIRAAEAWAADKLAGPSTESEV